ncbi:MAG: hypothetical protein WCH21_05065 [Bacteroidota bacterium]
MQKEIIATAEIDSIDIRYSSFRLPDKKRTDILLSSIAENGILENLQGVMDGNTFILLDGFKRIQCARKLNIKFLPIESIAEDCAIGIIALLKNSNAKSLHIFEQAKLIEELKNVHMMNIREIANRLDRSAGWVSMRLVFLKETTAYVKDQVFQGKFPARSAVYTLRQFTRVNNIPSGEVDSFVKAVSGKGLSSRDVDFLASAYFKGGNAVKKQIENGELSFAINKMKSIEMSHVTLGDNENKILNDLEIVQKYIARLNYKLPNIKSESSQFISMANLLTEGILSKINTFIKVLTAFDRETKSDRDRNKTSGAGPAQKRDFDKTDRKTSEH